MRTWNITSIISLNHISRSSRNCRPFCNQQCTAMHQMGHRSTRNITTSYIHCGAPNYFSTNFCCKKTEVLQSTRLKLYSSTQRAHNTCTLISNHPSYVKPLRRCLHMSCSSHNSANKEGEEEQSYVQGQSPSPGVREYFYYIDHQVQCHETSP